MKKAIIILLIISVGFTFSAQADASDLGTMDYGGSITSIFYGETYANLELIFSDLEPNTIEARRIGFDNNETEYQFISKHIPEFKYTFTPGIKEYIYQDKSTNMIYKICIDFSDIKIDDNPLLNELNKVKEANINLRGDIANLTGENANLQELMTNTSGLLSVASTRLELAIAKIDTLQKEKDQAVSNGWIGMGVAGIGAFMISYVFFSKKDRYLVNKKTNALLEEGIDGYSREARIVDRDINTKHMIGDISKTTKNLVSRVYPKKKPIYKETNNRAPIKKQVKAPDHHMSVKIPGRQEQQYIPPIPDYIKEQNELTRKLKQAKETTDGN